MTPPELENAPARVSGLWIPGPDGSVLGEVKDFEPSHSTVNFPDPIVLPVGRELEARLAFLSEDEPSPPLEVRIVARRNVNGHSTYRVQHRPREEFLELLSPRHRPLFETRRSQRCLPAETITVELGAEGVQGGAVGSLHDISPEGVAVLVAIETDQRFAQVDEVQVAFQLERDQAPYRMPARIRRRVLAARGLIYGLELAGADDSDLDAEHHRLREAIGRMRQRNG